MVLDVQSEIFEKAALKTRRPGQAIVERSPAAGSIELIVGDAGGAV